MDDIIAQHHEAPVPLAIFDLLLQFVWFFFAFVYPWLAKSGAYIRVVVLPLFCYCVWALWQAFYFAPRFAYPDEFIPVFQHVVSSIFLALVAIAFYAVRRRFSRPTRPSTARGA